MTRLRLSITLLLHFITLTNTNPADNDAATNVATAASQVQLAGGTGDLTPRIPTHAALSSRRSSDARPRRILCFSLGAWF